MEGFGWGRVGFKQVEELGNEELEGPVKNRTSPRKAERKISPCFRRAVAVVFSKYQ